MQPLAAARRALLCLQATPTGEGVRLEARRIVEVAQSIANLPRKLDRRLPRRGVSRVRAIPDRLATHRTSPRLGQGQRVELRPITASPRARGSFNMRRACTIRS